MPKVSQLLLALLLCAAVSQAQPPREASHKPEPSCSEGLSALDGSGIGFFEPVCVTCPNPYRKFICVDGQFLCGIENRGCSVGSDVSGCPNPGCPGMTPITPNGGNCQGNCWCSSQIAISGPNEIPVGQTLKTTFTMQNRIAHVDGRFRTPVGTPGGTIDWGDKTPPTPIGIDTAPEVPHDYKQPGTYTITVRSGGQFHWSAEGGSCSFYCFATGAKNVLVTPNPAAKPTKPATKKKQTPAQHHPS